MSRKGYKSKRYAASVKGLTGQRMAAYCKQNGMSVSGFLEDIIAAKLDAEGWPEETTLRPRVFVGNKSGPKPRDEQDTAGGIFTF